MNPQSYLLRERSRKIEDHILALKAYSKIHQKRIDEKFALQVNRYKARVSKNLNSLIRSIDPSVYQPLIDERIASLEAKQEWIMKAIEHQSKKQFEKTHQSQDEQKQLALAKALAKFEKQKQEIERHYQVKVTEADRIQEIRKQIVIEQEQVDQLMNAFVEKQNVIKDTTHNQYQTKTGKKLEKLEQQLAKVQSSLLVMKQADIDKHAHTLKQLEETIVQKPDDPEIKQQLDSAIGYRDLLEKDSDVLLRVQNLTMMFGGLKAVDSLSFDVKKGEIFGLIGPNGAGKTTVFNCITQFYKPNKGNILYRDANNEIISLRDYKVHDVIKEGIVRTFQNVELIWELNVLDNLLVGAHTFYRSGLITQLLHLPLLKREETVYRERAINILKRLDLLQYAAYYPLGLPYGILKRVELARTLMTNPRLIILDEPAAGLNDAESQDLAKVIKIIQKDFNCTIFLVEHDMGLVMDICDTVCAISFGKKLAIGTPEFIQQNKVVQESYLGGE